MLERQQVMATFRERLTTIVDRSGLSKTEFALRSGVDRSTLSQLQATDNRRLPRIETLVSIAAAHDVSIDWLLGLSSAGPMQAEMMQEHTAFEPSGRADNDDRLMEWLAESVGYKVRYVPSTIPDLLKSVAVITFELEHFVAARPAQRIETAAARLAWTRAPNTEMECCSSMQGLRSFALGEGIWSDLDIETRLDQLDHIEQLSDELYPTFRWFLFDGLERYASPVTIFGPLRASLYIGQMFLVLTSTAHVQRLGQHFDDLIRGAVVQPPDVPEFVRELRRDLTSTPRNRTATRRGD